MSGNMRVMLLVTFGRCWMMCMNGLDILNVLRVMYFCSEYAQTFREATARFMVIGLYSFMTEVRVLMVQ